MVQKKVGDAILNFLQNEVAKDCEPFDKNNPKMFDYVEVYNFVETKFDLSDKAFEEYFETAVGRNSGIERDYSTGKLYTISEPNFELICRLDLRVRAWKNKFLVWVYARLPFVLGGLVVILSTLFYFRKRSINQQELKEAKLIAKEIVMRLANRARNDRAGYKNDDWMSVDRVRALVANDKPKSVWKLVVREVAQNNLVVKGARMIDGIQQTSWRISDSYEM